MTNAQYAIKLTLEGAAGVGSALRGLWSGFSSGARAIVGVNQHLFYFGNNIASVFRTAQGLTRNTLSLVDALVGPNERFETASMQFEQLLGSADAAKDRIAELYKYAASTPFESPDVLRAGRILQAFGGQALGAGAGLQMTGDMAAYANTEMADVAMWVGRAYSAIKAGQPFGEAAARLQDLTLLTGDERRELENLAATKADPSIVWQKFMDIMYKTNGSTIRLGNSMAGVKSTLGDMWGEFKRLSGQGLFEALKGDLTKMRDDLQAAFDDGRIERWAGVASKAIADLYQNIRDKSLFGLTAADIMSAAEAGKLGETIWGAIKLSASNFWNLMVNKAHEFGPEIAESIFGATPRLRKALGFDDKKAMERIAQGDMSAIRDLGIIAGTRALSAQGKPSDDPNATGSPVWGYIRTAYGGQEGQQIARDNVIAWAREQLKSQGYNPRESVDWSDYASANKLGRFSGGMTPAGSAAMADFYRFNFGPYAEGIDRTDLFNPFGAARAAGAIGRGFIGDMADASVIGGSTKAGNLTAQLDELNAKLGDTVRLQTDLVRELMANIQRARGTF